MALEEPVVAFGVEFKAYASGDGLMHLAHVAELHPFGHGFFEPSRVADLLVEVDVGAGGLAIDDQVAVFALRLDDVACVGVSDVAHEVMILSGNLLPRLDAET